MRDSRFDLGIKGDSSCDWLGGGRLVCSTLLFLAYCLRYANVRQYAKGVAVTSLALLGVVLICK